MFRSALLGLLIQLTLLLAVVTGAGAQAAPGSQAATTLAVVVRGMVRDASNGAPLGDVLVEVVGLPFLTRTRENGSFELARLPEGTHQLQVRMPGFRPVVISTAAARPLRGDPGAYYLIVELERVPAPLASVVITPGHHGVLRQSVATVQTLTRDEIATSPQVGEDVFRVVSRLPGVAASDFSSAFRVRGGANDQLLVLLDGMQLYEPFHMKDLDGALSVVDVGSVGGVDLATGGFGAQYGDRTTGVLDMRSLTADPGQPRHELALTLTTLRATSSGSLPDDRGEWLFSARRGFLEYALRMSGEELAIDPRYYDVLGKFVFRPGRRHELSLHLLGAGDRLSYEREIGDPRLESAYGSAYVWGGWETRWRERLRSRTVIGGGRLDWERIGDRYSTFDARIDLDVRDERGFTFAGARQEWAIDLSSRMLLAAGVEARALRATYDYHRSSRTFAANVDRLQVRHDTLDYHAEPSGDLFGAWLSQRMRFWDPLTIEAGLRTESFGYGRAEQRRSHRRTSPRLSAAWEISDRTTVRAGWGHYYQSHGMHELEVADGEALFREPEHAVTSSVGVEHALRPGLTARAELYERRMPHVRPRWVGLDNTFDLFPEVGPNREQLAPGRGLARGVELLLRREPTSRLSWSASYALARAEDLVEDRWIPRALDQRHTITLDMGYRPSPRWRAGLAWIYHSGWPATAYTVTTETVQGLTISRRIYDERNSTRLAPYHRLDARVTRRFDLGGGEMAIFVDVFNLYGRRNARVPERPPDINTREQFDTLLPRVPSFGIQYRF